MILGSSVQAEQLKSDLHFSYFAIFFILMSHSNCSYLVHRRLDNITQHIYIMYRNRMKVKKIDDAMEGCAHVYFGNKCTPGDSFTDFYQAHGLEYPKASRIVALVTPN